MTNAAPTHHDEPVTTAPLFNRFLLLAVVWMAMAAFAAMAVEPVPADNAVEATQLNR